MRWGQALLPRLMRENGFRLHQGVFRSDTREKKKKITERVARHWNELPRALVGSPFKRCLGVAFGGDGGGAGERICDFTGLFPPLVTLTRALSVSCAHPEPCGGCSQVRRQVPAAPRTVGRFQTLLSLQGLQGLAALPHPISSALLLQGSK